MPSECRVTAIIAEAETLLNAVHERCPFPVRVDTLSRAAAALHHALSHAVEPDHVRHILTLAQMWRVKESRHVTN